jgi:phasin family protein
MFTNLDDMQKFGKEQFEAASAATASLTKSVQELAAEATEYSRKSLEDSSALFEKLLGAKSFDSALQIQSDFAKCAYEGWVAKSARFGELYANLAKEAFKPVEAAFAKANGALR